MKRHGLSIGIERADSKFLMSLKAVGKLTHEDYEIITPMIDSALAGVEQPQVRALVDGTEMEGWELRAAWDDFKLALKHGSEFERVAIFGNSEWQETLTRIGNWFVSGQLRYFEDRDSALAWLCE